MGEITQYISAHWVEWLFTVISALFAMSYRRMAKRQEEERKQAEASAEEERRKNTALHDGMQALLRDRIIQTYNHYHDKGFCPIYGKENVKRMYDAYHVLGGNDVATELKDKLLKMPEEPTEREV